ncbi:hypothetical protein ACFPVX_03750 [Cohnella faecalis]|uniref:Uncharacterized protein n=1 Tax=Cohnella faecalis TaxID=2315694 RepID=A0A398CPZ4_9BACL|nr:hypothetical protein [Cohnella faecalis]RIE03369.1 hypothetical protein D3H35_11865 [Cohnella faecalis]
MKPYIRQYFFLILGGLIIVSGIGYTVIDFLNNNSLGSRVKIIAPDTKEVLLAPGRYDLFYEYSSKVYDAGIIKLKRENKFNDPYELISVKISDVRDGKVLKIVKESSTSFTLDDIKGESLYSFEVLEEGKYSVEIKTIDEVKEQITISLVNDFTKELFNGFKRVGIILVFSIPFLLIGWFMYSREERRRRIQIVGYTK